MSPCGWVMVAAGLAAVRMGATTDAAEPCPALLAVPVVDMTRVDPGRYTAASALAAGGGTPVEIALRIAGAFEGSTQHVVQVNEGGEAPSTSRVTVVRDGLLDDAVRGERWDVDLERTTAGAWRIREVKRAWRCWRGARPDRFASERCP